MRGRDRFAGAKPLIMTLVSVIGRIPRGIRLRFIQRARGVNGIFGLGARYLLLKTLARNCGDNVAVHPQVFLLRPDNLSVGNNVSIHPLCYLDATGGIDIGDDVSIAHGVTIMSSTHPLVGGGLLKDRPIELRKTVIESGVWIGAKATILAGCRLHRNAVVGAGAVVTADVAAGAVVAGVPARAIHTSIDDSGPAR